MRAGDLPFDARVRQTFATGASIHTW